MCPLLATESYLYALRGNDLNGNEIGLIERFDPVAHMWKPLGRQLRLCQPVYASNHIFAPTAPSPKGLAIGLDGVEIRFDNRAHLAQAAW